MVLSGIHIPTEASTADHWTVYFDKLKAEFGQVNARQLFGFTFAHHGSSALRFDNGFRLQMKERGVDITSEGLSAVMADLNDFGSSVSGLVSEMGSAFRWTLIGIAFLIALVAVAMIVNPRAALMATPHGSIIKRSRL